MNFLEKVLATKVLLSTLFFISIFLYLYYFILLQLRRTPILVAPSGTKISSDDLLAYINIKKHTYANLPLKIWENFKANHIDGCTRIPEIYDLNFNNDYWQKLDTSNGTFYLFGAYFDTRPALAQRRVVRILGLIDRFKPTVKTFCHLWFENVTAGIVLPVYRYEYLWKQEYTHSGNGDLQPYLMSCEVPVHLHFATPVVVSLVETPCVDAKTSFLVHNEKLSKSSPQEGFVVCVKGLSYINDKSIQIVEWLELLFEMGISKVVFYKFEVHPNTEKVLQYYETLGKIQVMPLSHPANEPNIPILRKQFHSNRVVIQWQNELIAYNDCFYRNMYKYKYISLLDIDEIIVPNKSYTWLHMMKELTNNGTFSFSSFCFLNVFFVESLQPWKSPEIPSFMSMMRTTRRHITHSWRGRHVKCIHKSSEILSLHNHYPLKCLGGNCKIFNVSLEVSSLQHYREKCSAVNDNLCPNEHYAMVMDDFKLWKYKEKLIPKVYKVVRHLHLK